MIDELWGRSRYLLPVLFGFNIEEGKPVQINISARHGHLSAASQDKIREKVERLQRYFDRVTSIQVTVDLEHRESPSVELRVSAEHTKDFVATDQGGEMMATLDRVHHKLETQLRKHKEKLTGHRSTGIKDLDIASESESETD